MTVTFKSGCSLQINSPMFHVEKGMVQPLYETHVRLLSAFSTYDTHMYISLAHYLLQNSVSFVMLNHIWATNFNYH
jgi:hypothetical protein